MSKHLDKTTNDLFDDDSPCPDYECPSRQRCLAQPYDVDAACFEPQRPFTAPTPAYAGRTETMCQNDPPPPTDDEPPRPATSPAPEHSGKCSRPPADQSRPHLLRERRRRRMVDVPDPAFLDLNPQPQDSTSSDPHASLIQQNLDPPPAPNPARDPTLSPTAAALIDTAAQAGLNPDGPGHIDSTPEEFSEYKPRCIPGAISVHSPCDPSHLALIFHCVARALLGPAPGLPVTTREPLLYLLLELTHDPSMPDQNHQLTIISTSPLPPPDAIVHFVSQLVDEPIDLLLHCPRDPRTGAELTNGRD